MRATRVIFAVVLLYGGTVLLTSCAGPQPPPFKPVADVKLLMDAVVDPQADLIWGSVATIITAAGTEERRPRTDKEWTAVRDSAVTLTESGNLLMMVPRAYDGGDWMKMSQAMVDAGTRAIRATEAKNVEALFTVGEQIDESCETCHQMYAYPDAPKRKR
jgi:hypothetical protein